MINNERPYEWYIIWLCSEKKLFPTHQLWRHNILYLMRYLVFPVFWSHIVLLKIGLYTKRNLMIYNLSMFGTKIFVVAVNFDVIGIQATGSLEKWGRTVFKIVSPSDGFETIKNGITLVTRLLQYFLCLQSSWYSSRSKAVIKLVQNYKRLGFC